ncbi:hypothetical protein HG530_009976 [Fusarium avenaceum]|nr:hypothetical protein HG530_009976 [Fusarium avenaceum]
MLVVVSSNLCHLSLLEGRLVSKVPEPLSQWSSTCHEENHRVPESLQGEDSGGGGVVLKGGSAHEPAVDAVQTARDPSHQHTKGEKEARALRLRLLDRSRLPGLGSSQALESIPSAENMPANHEVEEDRSSNTNPDEHIPAVRVSNQKQRNGNSKRATVADEAVHPPPSAERVGLGAEEEDEEDVEGHGQRPPGVRLHEPGGDILHMEHKALRLAKRRSNTQLQTIHGDDARTAGSDVGNACKDNKCVLDIAHPRYKRIGDENHEDSGQADRASYALKQHQRMPLTFRQQIHASPCDELVRHRVQISFLLVCFVFSFPRVPS